MNETLQGTAGTGVSTKAGTRAERRTGVQSRTKGKKNQIPYGIALLVAIVVAGSLLTARGPNIGIAWIFGIAFGFVLQRSRFCFTASLRDPVLTGGTSLTKAVIIAFAVATAGFAAIQYSAVLKGAEKIPGFVSPVGIHVAIGATMFGMGMVIAGGCASGTLMRMGEGFAMQWMSIIGFMVGSLWGAHDFGWWQAHFFKGAPAIHLPSVLGWPAAVFGQLALLGALYVLADRYEKSRTSFLS